MDAFRCVDCGYEGGEFRVEVESPHRGAFTYIAKCPRCGSRKVNALPGYHESDLRIGLAGKFSGLLPARPQEGPPLPKMLGIRWN